MNSSDLMLALINVAFCWWRAIATLRNGRLIALVWILIGYFAIFFIPVSVTKEIEFIRGFFDETVVVNHSVIHKVMIFVVAFNVIFASAEMLCWRLFTRGEDVRINWRYSLSGQDWNGLRAVLLSYWLIGGIWWFWQMRDATYRDYVEGASWGSVIFWASSPLILLAAMSGRRMFAVILCMPFLYFCVHLTVRSFALLSLVPMFVVGFYQLVDDSSIKRSSGRLLRYGVFAGGLLVALSIYVSQIKDNAGVAFPDSAMPFGAVETVAMVDRFDRHVGFDGLILYGWNYISPFTKLFGIAPPAIVDPPTVIAGLLEGVPPDWPVRFHFPALLWADAYISFAWAGLWMAGLWAAVLCVWELLMRRNSLLLALLLPFFCWHGYMLVRGAIAVASVPVSYSLYFSLFPFLLLFRRRLFSKADPAGAKVDRRQNRAPNNLMI